jgi:hypothetical protein
MPTLSHSGLALLSLGLFSDLLAHAMPRHFESLASGGHLLTFVGMLVVLGGVVLRRRAAPEHSHSVR